MVGRVRKVLALLVSPKEHSVKWNGEVSYLLIWVEVKWGRESGVL